MNPVSPPSPAPAALIRRVEGAHENARLLRKHIPAWVISGAVHVALIAALILVDRFMPKAVAVVPTDEMIVLPDDKPEDPQDKVLTNPFEGIDPELDLAVPTPFVDDTVVDSKLSPSDVPGVTDSANTTKIDVIAPPGIAMDGPPGTIGDSGKVFKGGGGGGDGPIMGESFRGRGPSSRKDMLGPNGGTDLSEAAVGRGLVWLAKQQKADGSWVFDGSSADATAASTGLALLPFLAAGQTHKKFAENKYQSTVEKGLQYLLSLQNADGSFRRSGPQQMYAHAIATVALCELYGMSGDKGRVHGPAMKAVAFLVASQGPDGSWGYRPKTNGDTSIVGWQIQALHSAKLCKDIPVPEDAFVKARAFLDKVSDSSKHATYGYTDRNGIKPSLTAVGLLSRYYGDKWGPMNPGMAAGVGYLMKNWMPNRDRFDMYYYYYATQVVHFYDGAEWHRDWNPKMRDMLIDLQVPATKVGNAGSWDPDGAIIGQHCGRLGTTCLALLTLEVYYRHLPLYKRDNGGLRELERSK